MNGHGRELDELSFHRMIDWAPAAVVLCNGEGRIAYLNRACEALFGWSVPELIGQSIEVLMPERLRDGHVLHRVSFMKELESRRMAIGRELPAQRKDGSEFPIEIDLNPMVLVDGTWVLAFINDMTERRRADARFRKVVDAAPSAMLLVDPQGRIVMANKCALALFDYPAETMMGLSMTELLPERLRHHHDALVRAYFGAPTTRVMGVGRELMARRRDGSELPVEIGLNPVDTEDGPMALAAVTDLTARLQHEDMRARKEAAEAASRAKGELLAIASHDLKNPLAAIAGLAEIMLEGRDGGAVATDAETEMLRTIRDAAQHMSTVVAGILDHERLDQRGLTMDAEPVDLSRLCDDVMRFNAPAAAHKSIQLEGRCAPGVRVPGNRTRLHEALDNYVSNAVKYSPAGRTVVLSLEAREGEAEFGVRDQGPGLTADDRARAFGKFKRLSARPTGGESSTGLGLSIVKTIVELHGGSVGCDSEPGRGAYFWARLPLA